MALVWYHGKTPRTPGLRLLPGWNAVNEPTATELVERGVVTREKPADAVDDLTPEEVEVLGDLAAPKPAGRTTFIDMIRGVQREEE